MAKTEATLDELRSLLQEAAKTAPPRSGTAYETVKGLYPDIRELKGRRFTDREIVDMLASKGFQISLGTFRQYVQRAARELDDNSVRSDSKPVRKISSNTKNKKDSRNAIGESNLRAKPSELAASSQAKPGAGAKATGHRLGDDDL